MSVLEDLLLLDPSPLFGMRLGLRLMKKFYIEEKIKDIDKSMLFEYLISNRVFIENLSSEDLKKYFKYLKKIYKNKRKEQIKNFFHFKKCNFSE